MSKDGNANTPDGNDNREDIRCLENYEQRRKINHIETLKNEDILNYIKDIERNCRLGVSSGDEDYAGTKRSSNCSVRCSGTRFRSSKTGKSRVTSGGNKNVTPAVKKIKRNSDRKKNTSNYYCSSRKSRFCGNPELTIRENSTKDVNTFAKSTLHYPKSSSEQDLDGYRELPPRFYGSYSSRRDRETWPAVTETTSLEIVRDRFQRATLDSGINESTAIDGKPVTARTFKSLDKRKFNNLIYTYPDIALKTRERDLYCRGHERHDADPRIKELKGKSDVGGFINHQRSLDKFDPGQEGVDHNSSNGEKYKGLVRAYPRRGRQPTSWSLDSRSNRLMARRPDASSLSRGRISQWDNETMGPPLKASSPVTRVRRIDESYRRPGESRYKNNTNQLRREPASVLEERGSSCCRRLSTRSGKLCEAIRTREDKRQLGCCCEDAEQNETADCATYCRCPENVNDPTRDCWTRRENAYRSRETSKRTEHAVGGAPHRETLSESPGNNVEVESDFDSSMGKHVQFETSRGYLAFDISDDTRARGYGDKIELEDLEPRVSFPDDWTYERRRLNEPAREYKKSSNDLKRETRRTLRKKITGRYPSGVGSSVEIRTSDKLAPGDFARYDVAESTCECRESFRDSPAAARLTGSCSCIGSNSRAENNDSVSSEGITCPYCSSVTSCNDEDPVKKLETFCEKVKAVNRDAFEMSRSTCCNAARINARQYSRGDRDVRDPSEISVQMKTQAAKSSIEREWLADRARLRIGKPRHNRNSTYLEKILIYPPRGDSGPPLTLYKKSSNVNCRVEGDGNAGFRYSVTYVQKFVSPTWTPSVAPEIPSRETDVECDCSADYG